MKITFKLINEQEVDIMNGEQKIGNIFSPSGSGKYNPEAIQVCGFDDAFDLWGCGRFGDKDANPKKDIQLMWKEGNNGKVIKIPADDCLRCFHSQDKCRCFDLRVKHEGEIFPVHNVWSKDEEDGEKEKTCFICGKENSLCFDEYLTRLNMCEDCHRKVQKIEDLEFENEKNKRTAPILKDLINKKIILKGIET